MFECSQVYLDTLQSAAKVVINQGGTWSGKTYSILQVLCTHAVQQSNLVITVAGQDIPNLKAGPLRDMERILRSSTWLRSQVASYNRTERVYEFASGTIMEFNSYDDEQDAKSGKRDYLFVNEANGIPYPVFKQLALRTDKQVLIDYNPSAAFWVHELVLTNAGLYPSVELLISDHRHNPFISADMHAQIERLRHENEETWRVYARGLTGKVDGLVLKNVFVCDAIPEDAKFLACGIDFGFTNDATGCLEVYLQNGELWVNELIYETGLTNPDISRRFKALGLKTTQEIIADSAEPKSIEELRRIGWYITPARKGPDSILHGLDILQRYRINVTRRSTHLRAELGKYSWKKDRLGKTLNEPIDAFNHLIDPLRYIALNKLKSASVAQTKTRLPWQQSLSSNLGLGEMI
jgi:phage terminase large subunit